MEKIAKLARHLGVGLTDVHLFICLVAFPEGRKQVSCARYDADLDIFSNKGCYKGMCPNVDPSQMDTN